MRDYYSQNRQLLFNSGVLIARGMVMAMQQSGKRILHCDRRCGEKRLKEKALEIRKCWTSCPSLFQTEFAGIKSYCDV